MKDKPTTEQREYNPADAACPSDREFFEILRDELRKCVEAVPYVFKDEHNVFKSVPSKIITAIPYLDRPEDISFLYCGFEVTLTPDGTWHWEDTTGG